ncbi:MAG: YgiQ family radical SAM protein [Elusimicrobia bacterium]|nr:YgiQ family radical SAM protein [Elusimicrobiota bacterium]
MTKTSFLPMFPDEMKARGWAELDVLLVSGDPYVDHPAYGTAVIGRLLEAEGYKVGIIAQPRPDVPEDFTRLGRPRLCACVAAGNVDSMIMNYTANKRRRRPEEGKGFEGTRPDRASIVYTNRLRAVFKGLPVILGGVEASMRRLAHYDYWDDAVRRSLLLDAKADMILYGMAERQVVEVVARLARGEDIRGVHDVRGTVVAVKKEEIPSETVELPSFEDVRSGAKAFNRAFALAYHESDPVRGKPVVQAHAGRYVLALPPARPLSPTELDRVYELPYVRRPHPFYDRLGGVKGFETVRWSIVAVRGCPGECHFCGLTMHQGRIVQSRSHASILREAGAMARHPDFRGTITDVGGPTANLYAAECRQWDTAGACAKKGCLMPSKCRSLKVHYDRTLALYRALRRIPGVKHVFVASGLRYDLFLDPASDEYFREVCAHHVGGQMKVAPEHTENKVLSLMNKPPFERYEEFVKKFEKVNASLNSRRYLVNYFISAHPGSRLEDAFFFSKKLQGRGMRPEQVQDFLPLPMTVAACLYHTGAHPFTGERVFVPRGETERAMQRALIQPQNPRSQGLIRRALRVLGK